MPKRLALKEWAQLDDLRQKITAKAEEGNWMALPDLIAEYIRFCGERADVEKDAWFDTVSIYVACTQAQLPAKKFPILTSKEKHKKMPWEYEGRTWYFWLNLFANHYGWSDNQIAVMDVDDAIGLYQEILIGEQMEDEFEYGLHEVAYEYNTTTKKSKFRPLPRPDWMAQYTPEAKKTLVKKIKMPKSMMPVGNIETLTED